MGVEIENKYVSLSERSVKHVEMKHILYNLFKNSGYYKEVKLKYKVRDFTPDIYLVDNRKNQIVVECEENSIGIEEFKRKTAYYSYQGYYVLWVFTPNNVLDNLFLRLVHNPGGRLRYTISEVERRIHKWYYGRVYYLYNEKIYSAHFFPQGVFYPPSCSECIKQSECTYDNKHLCPDYKPGYYKFSRTQREVGIYPVIGGKLVCTTRSDRILIAKFNDPTWWKI